MNKVMVTINGSDYPMVGHKSEQEMRNVASYVDMEMKRVKEKNPRLSLSVASIVTALNITDILFECSKENDDLSNENKELKDKISSPDEELKSEIELLKIELETKCNDYSQAQTKIDSLCKENEDKLNQIEELSSKLEKYIEQVENCKSQIDELNSNVEEGNERAKIAESLASEFQNKAYSLQLKFTELENKIKDLAVLNN